MLAVLLAVLTGFAGLASAPGSADLRLIDAVRNRDHRSVSTLMKEPVDVNAAQPDGATALAWAVHLQDHQIAKLLLAAGADVNTSDEYGDSPLTLACANGGSRLVEKLLEAGADPNAARWNGETALMLAAGAGLVNSAELLLAKGARWDKTESRRQRQIEFPQRRLEIPTQGLKKKSCSRPLRRPFPRSSFL